MKKRMKTIIMAFLTAVILCVTVFAAPAITWKTIDVAYADYKIYIDGVQFESSDKNGVIEPFSYNNWIYAPFEHIAKALGKEVRWDGNTNSLYIQQGAYEIWTPPPPVIEDTAAIETKTFEGRLEKSDSVGEYKFTLPYSARVTMSFEHGFLDSNSQYWIIQFISKNGVLAEFNSRGNIVKTDLWHALYLPADDYTVRVKAFNSYYHSNIDYKVNITYEKNIGQFEYEPNDSMETATPIQFNKAIKGNLLWNGDVDFYKLTVTSKKEISLKFTHDFIDNNSRYWTIELVSPNNGILLSFDSRGNVMETISDKITLIDPGDYYIKIKPINSYYHSNVDYNITVIE